MITFLGEKFSQDMKMYLKWLAILMALKSKRIILIYNIYKIWRHTLRAS